MVLEDNCHLSTTLYDGIISSASLSVVTAAVCGVLFTGIVLLVAIRSDDARAEQSRITALEILTPAFFCLLIGSFLFAIESGEDVCKRADSEDLAAGAILALMGLATFQAMAWMFKSFGPQSERMSDIIAMLQFAGGVFVNAQVAVKFHDAEGNYDAGAGLSALLWCYLAILVVLSAAIAWQWFRRRRLPRATGWWGPATLLIFTGIQGAFFDLALNSGARYWGDHLPVLLGFQIVIVPLLLIVGTTVVLLGSPTRA